MVKYLNRITVSLFALVCAFCLYGAVAVFAEGTDTTAPTATPTATVAPSTTATPSTTVSPSTTATPSATATPSTDATVQTASATDLQYRAHVQNIGWQEWVNNGATAGTTGKAQRLEALEIKSNVSGVSVSYKVQVQGTGWQTAVSDGQTAGTVGEAKQLEAVQISLSGENAANYSIYYRVHLRNLGWLGWAKNGETAGAEDGGVQVEAIEIKLVSAGSTESTAIESGNTAAKVTTQAKYQTHVQDIGWQGWVTQGTTSGTIGQSKRVEAIQITASDSSAKIAFTYNTHLQNVGWQGWKTDGQTAGTTGESRRMEAIQIKLTGDDAGKYDVYYRVHVQNLGWLGWAKNGAEAGSSGFGYRMEAIEIKVLPKDSMNAPDTETGYAYKKYSKVYSNSMGVDVSEWNGSKISSIIDWNAAKKDGVNYAIIRTGWGQSGDGRADYDFTTNYSNAKSAGLPIGVYHYSYATTTEDAVKEAKLCLSILGGRSLDLPVAFDAEDETTLGTLSKDQVTDIIIAFCDTIKAAGYQPMVYANLNWYTNKIDYSRLGAYKIWLAQYNDAPTFSNHFDMWQYRSDGAINGIGGRVDMNMTYSDF